MKWKGVHVELKLNTPACISIRYSNQVLLQ